VLDLSNNDCFSTPVKHIIIHSKTHLMRLAAGLRSDPLGGELTTLARPHAALSDREPVLIKEGGTKRRGWQRI